MSIHAGSSQISKNKLLLLIRDTDEGTNSTWSKSISPYFQVAIKGQEMGSVSLADLKPMGTHYAPTVQA